MTPYQCSQLVRRQEANQYHILGLETTAVFLAYLHALVFYPQGIIACVLDVWTGGVVLLAFSGVNLLALLAYLVIFIYAVGSLPARGKQID